MGLEVPTKPWYPSGKASIRVVLSGHDYVSGALPISELGVAAAGVPISSADFFPLFQQYHSGGCADISTGVMC